MKEQFNKTLREAARRGNVNIIELMLKNGADISSYDENNYTALHYAIQRNDIKAVRSLLENNKIYVCRIHGLMTDELMFQIRLSAFRTLLYIIEPVTLFDDNENILGDIEDAKIQVLLGTVGLPATHLFMNSFAANKLSHQYHIHELLKYTRPDSINKFGLPKTIKGLKLLVL